MSTEDCARVECRAERVDSRWWIGTITELGVYTCGKNLSELKTVVADAAALALNTSSEGVDVELVPVAPGLEALRRAREAEETALREAVRELRALGVAWPDVARVTRTPQTRVRATERACARRNESIPGGDE